MTIPQNDILGHRDLRRNRRLLQRTWFAGLCLLFSCMHGYAQSTVQISGTVTSAGDNVPLAGASVYLNNTTIGTVTSEQGRFDLDVQPGNYELVVSYIGYKPVSVPLDERSPHEHLRIALHPSDKRLGEVVVRATSHWDEYLLQFKQFFLGKGEHAKACTIQNPKALSFH